MRKAALIFLIFLLSYFSVLFANETELKQNTYKDNIPSDFYIDSFSLSPSHVNKEKLIAPPQTITSDKGPLPFHDSSPKVKNNYPEFSLVKHNPQQFDFKLSSYVSPYSQGKKSYAGAFLDISGINLAVWSFDKFILKKEWAQISVKSVINNLDNGFEWDKGTFISNNLAHPYHGALYFSSARLNGLDTLESTFYTAAGSLMWELFFESNYPSINDALMTTLGGVVLGGPLYQIAGSLWSQNSTGFKGILQKTLTLFINPSFSYSLFPKRLSGLNLFPEDHDYRFHFPIGTYWSTTNQQKYLLGLSVENTDYIKRDLANIKPYDWFLLDCRLGFQKDNGLDKEIFTTVMLSGTKTKYGLRGVFGIYDYLDTQTINMLSAAGIGIGAVSTFNSEPDFFTNASGVFSLILGSSSPSIDQENCQFGQKNEKPYYFGPGLMSRFKIEMGKQKVGSILAKFSQYWVNSLFSNAQESLSISSFNIKISITQSSQINLGYDCYIRRGTFFKQNVAAGKNTLKIFYIHKF
jgi:hypothetical protein